MIDIQNLSFGYDHDRLSLANVSLHIPKGQCILLCGESGCGKTTLTKTINGLIPHFYQEGFLKGQVMIQEKSVQDMKMHELAKIVGSVFQNPKSQFFHTGSDAEIIFGLENEGMSPKQICQRYNEVIQELDINHLIHRNVFSMSGGEKQQLAFTSVYAMSPTVYVLDEPTANIDQGAIARLRTIIQKVKDKGHTIIIAEHRLYFLKDIIDQVIFIKDGIIHQMYDGQDFFKLSNQQRIQMGLRTLHQETLILFEKDISSKMVQLEVSNLTCAYKNKTVFENINLTIQKGDILGIYGKNGVGKSTLCRCICGLHKENHGQIKWKGHTMNTKERRKLCDMVMQDVNHQLFSDSVYEECLLGNKHISEDMINQVLEEFDLLAYKHQHPMSLSGGQKQRLAIVVSILSNKKIIVFDEPTSGLDYERMIRVSNQVKDLSQKGCCVIIISHDIEFINLTCNRIFKF